MPHRVLTTDPFSEFLQSPGKHGMGSTKSLHLTLCHHILCIFLWNHVPFPSAGCTALVSEHKDAVQLSTRQESLWSTKNIWHYSVSLYDTWTSFFTYFSSESIVMSKTKSQSFGNFHLKHLFVWRQCFLDSDQDSGQNKRGLSFSLKHLYVIQGNGCCSPERCLILQLSCFWHFTLLSKGAISDLLGYGLIANSGQRIIQKFLADFWKNFLSYKSLNSTGNKKY